MTTLASRLWSHAWWFPTVAWMADSNCLLESPFLCSGVHSKSKSMLSFSLQLISCQRSIVLILRVLCSKSFFSAFLSALLLERSLLADALDDAAALHGTLTRIFFNFSLAQEQLSFRIWVDYITFAIRISRPWILLPWSPRQVNVVLQLYTVLLLVLVSVCAVHVCRSVWFVSLVLVEESVRI